MSDFTRTILKWVIVGLVFIICIILLTNLFGREQQKNNNQLTNKGVIIDNNNNTNINDDLDEEIEDDTLDDSNLEPIENDQETSNNDTYYVDAPDTASKSTIMSILGIIITTTGIIYLYNNRKVKRN